MYENQTVVNITNGTTYGLFPPIVALNFGAGNQPAVSSAVVKNGTQVVITFTVNGGAPQTATIDFQEVAQ